MAVVLGLGAPGCHGRREVFGAGWAAGDLAGFGLEVCFHPSLRGGCGMTHPLVERGRVMIPAPRPGVGRPPKEYADVGRKVDKSPGHFG